MSSSHIRLLVLVNLRLKMIVQADVSMWHAAYLHDVQLRPTHGGPNPSYMQLDVRWISLFPKTAVSVRIALNHRLEDDGSVHVTPWMH